ncbi:MAG: OmpH family outer membrane protein [Nevskia sp.]|nr:OmpH family outer membrane protein [Nevskia sp.]
MIQQRMFAAIGVAAVLCCLAAPAFAETKIAAINFEEVVNKSPQYKSADAKVTAEFGKRRTDIETQGKQLNDDAQKYQKDRDVLSGDARSKTEKDLQQRQIDLQYAQKKFQDDFVARNRELTQQIVSQIRSVITAVAKEKGYDLVVTDPVYATPAVDISDDVLKRLASAPDSPK